MLSDPTMESGSRVTSEVFKAYAEGLVARDGKDAVISFDPETNAEDIRDGRGYMTSFGLGLSLTGKEVFVSFFPVALGGEHNEGVNDPSHKEWLFKFLENFPGKLVMHNAKHDLEVLYAEGFDYKGDYYDTMLMCHLINENFPFSKDLSSCVMHYVSKDLKKKDDKYFDFLVSFYGWANIPAESMRVYNEHDAYITFRLFQKIIKKFLAEVPAGYWNHKKLFMNVVRAMERPGIAIDIPFCRKMIELGEEKMEKIRAELGGFNPGSSKDLEKLFIDKMGLPVVKVSKTTGAPSFDKEAMEEYERLLEDTEDPTAILVLEYRGWQKTVSSNYRSYVEKVSPDGRLRPNYKLHGTKTGRMSCSDPNLQQIPRSSTKPWNGNLKEAFVAAPGYELWEFDYSQLELRLATAYAKESSLADVFNEGRDIFSEMAVAIGLPRQATKTFVYATQYGAGIDRLMYSLGLSRERVEQIRQDYRDAYPGFVAVSNRASRLCKATGKVQLWSGRYRHFWSKYDDAHKAFNSVCQGGAADIVESVMVRLYEKLGNSEDCRILLTVHDSVIFEIRRECVAEYTELIEEVMSNVEPDFGVKFAVEGKKFGVAA